MSLNQDSHTTDNYSIDRAINFYLKQYVFERNAWFTFCHVFRMSVTYKIKQNELFKLKFTPRKAEQPLRGFYKKKKRKSTKILKEICLERTHN